MGLNKNTKLAILHSSYTYAGQQIPTSWNLQGSLRVQLLIGHLQHNDLVGQHMRHILDYIYLHVGHTAPLCSYDYK